MWKVWKYSAWLGASIMISKETSLAEIIGQILILAHLRSLGFVLAFAHRQTLFRLIRTKYPATISLCGTCSMCTLAKWVGHWTIA